jgi:hypothetical protein
MARRLSESQLETIGAHPIKDGLDSFRAAFKSTYADASIRDGFELVTDPGESDIKC